MPAIGVETEVVDQVLEGKAVGRGVVADQPPAQRDVPGQADMQGEVDPAGGLRMEAAKRSVEEGEFCWKQPLLCDWVSDGRAPLQGFESRCQLSIVPGAVVAPVAMPFKIVMGKIVMGMARYAVGVVPAGMTAAETIDQCACERGLSGSRKSRK